MSCGDAWGPYRSVCRLSPRFDRARDIYLQGAIMGMKRAEIDRKFDAIVDFAGIRSSSRRRCGVTPAA